MPKVRIRYFSPSCYRKLRAACTPPPVPLQGRNGLTLSARLDGDLHRSLGTGKGLLAIAEAGSKEYQAL